MRFVFEVSVEVARSEGKFAGREEISDQILEALEGADPGSYDGEAGGMYETTDWSVSEIPPVVKPKRAAKPKAEPAPTFKGLSELLP